MSFELTERAAAQIRKVAGSQGGLGVRLGVKHTGCSGLSYTYDIASTVEDGDLVVKAHDACLVISRDAVTVVDGGSLDFVSEGFKQIFTVSNPNVKATCGCGESFTV
jgi:iron-sulfur cluster assembly protein